MKEVAAAIAMAEEEGTAHSWMRGFREREEVSNDAAIHRMVGFNLRAHGTRLRSVDLGRDEGERIAIGCRWVVSIQHVRP